MSTPLKQQNVAWLVGVIAANATAFGLFAHTVNLANASYSDALQVGGHAVGAGVAAALLTILNGILGPQTKARLVFWRWSDPLPASRAFSMHAGQDPRINVPKLKQKLGKWPRNPKEQNSTWYGVYRSVESDAAVTTNHKDYLFARDYAGLSALFVVFLGGLAAYQFDDYRRVIAYVAFLVGQYLVVRYVASQYGNRFVTTVLATKSAEP